MEYIESRAPGGARCVKARIQAVTDLLSRHPQIGGRTDDPAIRRVVTSPYPYLVFYEVTEAEIVIHAI